MDNRPTNPIDETNTDIENPRPEASKENNIVDVDPNRKIKLPGANGKIPEKKDRLPGMEERLPTSTK